MKHRSLVRPPLSPTSLVVCCLLLVNCSKEEEPATLDHRRHQAHDPNTALYEQAETAKRSAPGKRFSRMPASETGVTFGNRLDNIIYGTWSCGGTAMGDLDGDGSKDLVFTSRHGTIGLYLQESPWKFKDATAASGIRSEPGVVNAGTTLTDVNGDGHLDLYICRYDAPNRLYLNRGDATFHEAAREAGLDVQDASVSASFADIDRDGDLDVYVVLNRLVLPKGRPPETPVERQGRTLRIKPEYAAYLGLIHQDPQEPPMIWEIGRSDRLLRNDGMGTDGVPHFTDISEKAGISDRDHGLACLWMDPNEDGYPDLHVANDYIDPDKFYRNNHDGTFSDMAKVAMPHTSWFSMGSDEADVNNDGLMDFIVLDMAATSHYRQKVTMGDMGRFRWTMEHSEPRQMMRNALHINTGTGRYQQLEYLAGLANSDWSWTPLFGDFDLDGWNDLFITNGVARDYIHSDIRFSDEDRIGKTEWDLFKDLPAHPETNLAFRGLGDLRFEDVSESWGLDELSMAFSAAVGDLDNDGDLDLVFAGLDQYVSLYQNHSSGSGTHYLRIQLAGNPPNTQAIGAKLEIRHPTLGTLTRRVNPHRGFMSSQPAEVHFGLGSLTDVDLTIVWPGGLRQHLFGLAADRLHVIHEKDAQDSEKPPDPPTPPFFRRISLAESMAHRERAFDDFSKQPLLPNQLSQLGPALAVADVNGDGRDDAYLGGAAGQASQLLIHRGFDMPASERFGAFPNHPFEEDSACEDMGAVFFDADADGDPDLYVASGSYEFAPGSAELRDRLYLNDGQGRFTKAPDDALPEMFEVSSAVAAADVDGDGDVDLFVGTRLIPGDYPTPANSHLLANESEAGKVLFRLVDVPALRSCGLVTAAVWTDFDNDGWLDLVLAREWGSLLFLHNDNGSLNDWTTKSGVAFMSGWWNSVAASDLDLDGDMDLVAGNWGFNTKYHAGAEKPALLYYGDYAGTGNKHLVEAEFEDETLFPIRGKSCSTRAMPHLADKFRTFHDFASASLQEVYPEDKLQEAQRFAATTLASGIFWNDGPGAFTFAELPTLAQVSPVFGIAVADLDGDALPEVMLAQNFFTPQHETGRFDTGLGLFLKNRGRKKFETVTVRESGLMLPGDTKAIAVMDLNGDAWPDLLAAENNGPVRAFLGVERDSPRLRKWQIPGGAGVARNIGARVTMQYDGVEAVLLEIQAGSGYLSQQSAISWLPARADVTLRRPDGTSIPFEAER
ncbi:MAG TPA: VCBS repeat-containing protein [Verrucomicrobiales bacterium]|nr:VCBS repeat-containing protein [Verrucomicrobiales bacterium]